MKSSSHSLIPFLSLFCCCLFGKLDSIQFLCSPSSPPGRLASRNSTLQCSPRLLCLVASQVKVKVKVTLRLTVSQSVSGAHNQIFISVWQLRSCFVGRPLWWEDGSVFCICLWECHVCLRDCQKTCRHLVRLQREWGTWRNSTVERPVWPLLGYR
jgi:hypothetical protein